VIVGAIARGVFKSIWKNGFDVLRLTRQTKEQVLGSCVFSGEENLRGALERGKGILAVTGHIGAWELLAACLSEKGYRLSVIAGKLSNDALHRLLVGLRRRHGVGSFFCGRTAAEGYRTLKRGEILGMFVDRGGSSKGFRVPFFGRPAWTTARPAEFALRSGAAVVPMAIHMQPGGTHQITILPEIEHPPKDLPGQERRKILTGEMSAAIEKLVRLNPQQWIWFHDRWHVRKEDLDRCGDPEYLQMGGIA
jgi:KDO2-lipid IV(A) lauroyltransferase